MCTEERYRICPPDDCYMAHVASDGQDVPDCCQGSTEYPGKFPYECKNYVNCNEFDAYDVGEPCLDEIDCRENQNPNAFDLSAGGCCMSDDQCASRSCFDYKCTDS